MITYACSGPEAKHQCMDDASAPQVPLEDAQYVYEMLKDDFAQTWKEWTDAQPQVKIQLSLPSLVDPLKRLL